MSLKSRAGKWVVAMGLAAAGGCSLLFPAPVPAPEEPVVEPPADPYPAWTARSELDLDGYTIARLFTALEVVREDSSGLYVRCLGCESGVEPVGYLAAEHIVHEALPPEVAAWSSLADFALAIRNAADRLDVEALLPVMVEDFSFSFVGIQSPGDAIDVWRSEDFATLREVPSLLDAGLSTLDGEIWSGPPAFAEQHGYRGTRLGFRQRADGRWEWLYLIRGIVP